MDAQFKEYFTTHWNKYLPNSDLPIVYYFTDQVRPEEMVESVNEYRCWIGNLMRVLNGFPFVYHADLPGCEGGKRYTGMSSQVPLNHEYFLSYGIPGVMEGSRHRKSPEVVRKHYEEYPAYQAPGRYLVFKRWDKLAPEDEPFAVIFYATADVLSGLVTLGNYDLADVNGTISPYGSGCESIIYYPYLQSRAEHPKCVLGHFDISGRPSLPKDRLSLTIPLRRFEEMVRNMDESFLSTPQWNSIRDRL